MSLQASSQFNHMFERWAETKGLSPTIRNQMFQYLKEVGHKKNTDIETKYRFLPVPIQTFIESPEYMGKSDQIYPEVMSELIKMNNGNYVEAVLTGGIGSGKTTAALYSTAYQLYLMSCLREPHETYQLDPSSEILLIFQNKTERLAKQVAFKRFKTMIDESPYFTNEFPYAHRVESMLMFPHRIEVMPLSGDASAAIGQNVMGGVIDELNYMDVTKDSKRSIDGGMFDQAVSIYNSIARRRKSRFQKLGKLPGLLCLVSSRRYPGQFTDLKEAEAKKDPTIYVYDKCVWEIQPNDPFVDGDFHVFTGDSKRKPRILNPGEEVSEMDQSLIRRVPVVYKHDFEVDIYDALREIAGVSTLALFPFFTNLEYVSDSFGHHDSILSDTMTDFVSTPLAFDLKKFWKPDIPRWVHIDLSLKNDATGIACGCVPGFTALSRGVEEHELLPQIRYDFTLRVVAPRGGEILYYKIRSLIYLLREAGLNIRWVSFDSYQSTDMIQILRQNDFMSGQISMDSSTLPYEILKTATYDQRIMAPPDSAAELEIASLEHDQKTGKVDHPPNGSKDVADAMAGVAYGLTMRREVWVYHDVPLNRIPLRLQERIERDRDRVRSKSIYDLPEHDPKQTQIITEVF